MSTVRTTTRVRIDDAGALEVIDPGFDAVPLLQSVDPDFRVRRSALDGFVAPRLLRTRSVGCGVPRAILSSLPRRDLRAIHDAGGAALLRRRPWGGPRVL